MVTDSEVVERLAEEQLHRAFATFVVQDGGQEDRKAFTAPGRPFAAA